MKYLVIKCGGSVFEALPASFYSDIVELQKSGQWQPVLVHGGGPLINSLLKKLNVQTHFVNGLRVTTEEMLDIVEMVLSGSVNKQVVRKLVQAGGKAYGISGVDGGLLQATQVDPKLGFVGEVTSVEASLLTNICEQGYIPVVSPIGVNQYGQRYNINGDVAASAVAKALEAKLCLISDIPGIMVQNGNEKAVLKIVTKTEVEKLIEDEVITGGMIPKVKAAIDGLVHRVPEVAIINGLEPNSLLDFCSGKEVGTKLVLDKEVNHV
jgi:acetylglutamate kinase